jgi:hypothetical protein
MLLEARAAMLCLPAWNKSRWDAILAVERIFYRL